MKRKIIILGCLLLLLFGVCILLFQISKSRTFQFFGEIYPRVETQQKVVALTFDDGPTRKHTDEILGILREENVKATFYLVGSAIEENQGETEKIIQEGHEIGNHTYHHKRMILVSPDVVKNEIETTDELIKKAGYKGDITFRPPFGKKLFALPFYLSEHNRNTITWDVDPETFVEKSEDIIKYTLKNTKNGSIILLHVAYDSRAESMKSVRPIIKNLREKGFEFKTVSELLSIKN
ncbi:MAG: polysaccharide deacetylase family protein [Acidobacteria bacterium]|nr:polysaccharide deacetylase family protein [Acidobacteriota bacterium]MCA1637137.1 polysaccharide deacetylase family protein [Acidobacteriota bacterium]